MPAQVKLRHGNLFDGPTDLIILPCSTGGTVTPFVAHYLNSYSLPVPPRHLDLGQVHIVPFSGGQNIAEYVAYAASVIHNTSKPEAIHQIGRALGEFTKEESTVRAVSAPLLGTGAGSLDSRVAARSLKEGFIETAAETATLTISVLDQEDYDRVASQPVSARPTRRPVRVFISFTASDEAHAAWVESLGTFLRSQGVEARLYLWHLKRGMDLPQWMTNELQMADRVLIVSNEQYAAKADGRLGGVGWETMIIQGDMAVQKADSQKYLVIVRCKDLQAGTPRYLRTKYAFHSDPARDDSAMRAELLKELLEISSEPPLGAPVYI